jgi:CubicO group peptidase (beta-lactamase class C family)
MITRRTVLRAAVVSGLAGYCGRALAQSKRKRATRQANPDGAAPVQGDERVAQVLAPVRDTHHLPGLVGAIVTGNRLAAIGAIGIRKIGSPEPIRVADQIHLGSNTKAMTATVIGMLVDEGTLSWQTTIRDAFPDLASQLHPDFQAVTLSHLLTHRAGLPANTSWWWLRGKTPTEQRKSLLATIMKDPPRSRPGATYTYSNVGYTLAGLMAEQATGESWEALMRRRLFEPLGMATAGFGTPGRRGTVEQPWGHRSVGENVVPTQEDNPPVMGPAGTVHCSTPDWARFAGLHLAGAQGHGKLLKVSTFRALQTPPAGFEYAGGWVACERTWAGGRALCHSGSNNAWFATVWLAPARNFAILAATNQGGTVAQTAVDEAVVELIRSADFLTRPAG